MKGKMLAVFFNAHWQPTGEKKKYVAEYWK